MPHKQPPRSPKPALREFTCKGTMQLDGVIFYVKASSLREAREKAASGIYSEYDLTCHEPVDWEMKPVTVEPNE
jgi:hypothetical protein